MELSVDIHTDRSAYRRRLISALLLILVSLIIGTFLRVSLFILYPFVALLIAYFYNFRISSSLIILSGFVFISFLLSLFENLYLKYKLLSLFYMVPFILLLFSTPTEERQSNTNHLAIFFKCLSVVALVNNIIGFVQVIKNPKSDDSFIGLYSDYSISINGLMLLNSILFYYHFSHFIRYKKLIYLLPAIFFLMCAFLAYYGAGMITVIVAFILSFLTLRLSSIIKTAAIGMASIAVIIFLMYLIKPLALEYNIANVKKIIRFEEAGGARKMLSFYNYAESYPADAKDFLFGSGPGTFNSRSAFIVGSPTYFQRFPFIKDRDQPYYFKNYAYTLWNENNTQKELYLDGFRNQPFSSILAFLGEYGLLFFLAFIWLYFRYYRTVSNLYLTVQNDRTAAVYFNFFKFLIILLPLLLLIDNYYEYPEIMLLILPGIKLSHAALLQRKLNLSAG